MADLRNIKKGDTIRFTGIEGGPVDVVVGEVAPTQDGVFITPQP